ncbi:hypothetical protein DYB37_005715 [Aphanomyces astaci]|uniref:Transmembrane protein n=1 Tax=Aphanomyces astaci TaxID=112090 RepID=A0A3R7B3L4_APHAT|nr:hypothetical protein DYB35_005769 [Aphanomyces astaci]RHZ33637.1 hypothetical protein DYB37_005715 [Aphanomyces astaci]
MLGIGWWCAFRHWRSSGDVSFLSKRAVLENKLLFVLQWMYLPIGLAVSRLWHCQDAPNPLDPTEMLSSMSVDATVACLGTTHTMALIGIAGGLGLPFLVGFPILLYHRINFIGAFSEPERHERFIQAKELTYLLNVSDDYYVLNVAQYASYSRDMRLFPVHVCVLKVVLLGVFTFGRSRYPSIDMQPLQGMLFAVVLIVVVTHRSWWASPFRCRSTAQLSFVLDSLLTFDAVMVAGVVVGTFCKKRARQLNWPTHIHMRPLVRHVAQVTKWVAALKAADHVLQRVCYFFVLSSFRLSLGNDQLHEMAALISEAYVEALGSAVLASERIDDCVNKFTSELQHYKVATRYSPNTKRFE